MNNLNDIIEKVKKLLALSNSPNENEAAVAQAKAAELMLKYSISQDSINTEEKKEDEPVKTFIFEEGEGNKVTWKGSLAGTIARFFNCEIYWRGSSIMFIGRKSDNDAVKYLYLAIGNQIQELTEYFWIRQGIKSGIHGKTWKQSFRFGCVDTLAKRFAAQKQQIIQEYKAAGTSLVVYDKLALQVHKTMLSLHLAKGNPVSVKSGAAYQSGTQAGNSINIGGNPGLNRPAYGVGNQAFRLTNKG